MAGRRLGQALAALVEPLAETLRPYLDRQVGRRRRLSVLGVLTAFQVNALPQHHRAHLVETARVLNGLTENQRRSLGISHWDTPSQSYDRLHRLWRQIVELIESGRAGLTMEGFANSHIRAAIPSGLPSSGSIAVDGTDVETWGALHGDIATVALDGDVDLDGDKDEVVRRRRKPGPAAKVLNVGADRRKVYTCDPDARAGHRSATNSRLAGPYVGFEAHLGVQTRDSRWTNNVDKITLSAEVPNVVTTMALVPAGTHRAKAIVGLLSASAADGRDLTEVIWDRGYSQLNPGTHLYPLAQVGITVTFELRDYQRGIKPFSGEWAHLIDGQLFSKWLPLELRDLPPAPPGVSAAEKAAYQDKFNLRARWRLVRHASPDRDGATRWKCPFCAGLLRSRQFPRTMRNSRRARLVEVPESAARCCAGIQTVMAADLPAWQPIPYGTTAWQKSMDRRQVVESVNAALKGGYVDLARGFFRVMGQSKMTFLLAFTVAGYNLDRVRSFLAKQEVVVRTAKSRAKRRKGTWGHLIDDPQVAPGTSSRGPPG